MKKIFNISQFKFPYDQYRFPGQAKDEKILFVTRENRVMLWIKRLMVVAIGAALLGTGAWLASLLTQLLNFSLPPVVMPLTFIISTLVILIGWWWVTNLWKKSLAFITTKRLAKIIHTTPFTKHTLSLPLEMIVDTGAYTKGFLPAIFKLATFTARSSAVSSGVATDDIDRINKKYFYLENISCAEDLQHYVNKLLNVFRTEKDKLKNFRPFIQQLKAGERDKFMEQYPQYWS